jgi:hypothetical protein
MAHHGKNSSGPQLQMPRAGQEARANPQNASRRFQRVVARRRYRGSSGWTSCLPVVASAVSLAHVYFLSNGKFFKPTRKMQSEVVTQQKYSNFYFYFNNLHIKTNIARAKRV